MQAAQLGAGVGIVERSVLGAELAADDLIQPFAAEYKTGWHYMLVTPSGEGRPSPIMRSFRDWLVAEAAALRR